MSKTCNINKNQVLALYFNEVEGKEKRNLLKHIEYCKNCRDYLSVLEQTGRTLAYCQEEAPLPNTIEMIMDKLPDNSEKPAPARFAFGVAPFVKIFSAILGVIAFLFLIRGKLIEFPFWEILKEWWFVKLFGSMGVIIVFLCLFGIMITLILSPVFLMESQSRKHKFYFS